MLSTVLLQYSTVYQDCTRISQELQNLQKLGAISCRLPHTTDNFSLDYVDMARLAGE